MPVLLCLNGRKFDERSAATKQLAAELDQHVIAVIYGLTNSDISAEIRARLREAVQSTASSSSQLVVDSIVSRKMLESPSVLLRLLETAEKNQEAATAISSINDRLQKLTGQNPGTTSGEWSTWLAKNGSESGRKDSKENSSPAKDEPVEKPTPFDSGVESLSALLTLNIDDKKNLRLDRVAWANRFGGKKMSQIFNETEQFFEKNSLPKSWLNIENNRFARESFDYPQVLFARFHGDVQRHSKALTSTFSSMDLVKNRKFNIAGVIAYLNFADQNLPSSESGLVFSATDLSGDGRYIIIEDDNQGSLNLLFVTRGMRQFVWFSNSVKNSKCFLHLIQDGVAETISNSNTADLFEQNRGLFDEKILPIFAEMGIEVSEKLGGPLNIENRFLPENGK